MSDLASSKPWWPEPHSTAGARPDVVLALRTVRGCYDDLMFRAAAAPGATLGQRLYVARRRASLSAAETANAAGLPAELVDAVEAGEPAADADTRALNDLIDSLDG